MRPELTWATRLSEAGGLFRLQGLPVDRQIRRTLQPRNWYHWISLLLLAALVPVLRSQHLPLKFDWITLGVGYWVVLAAQSVFAATLLALLGLPQQQLLQPFLTRYREKPLLLALWVIFFGILAWATGGVKALVLTVDVMALLELQRRLEDNDRESRAHSKELRQAAFAVLAPGAYFFFGFVLVLAYNSAIVSVRYNFAYDPEFAAMDRFLLRGYSVSDLTHWAVRTFPFDFFRGLEYVYFGMFLQIGAAIILVALCDGKLRALQLVGTILISYYLALGLFYLWPAQGPYYLCADHFSRFPAGLQAYQIQKTLIAHALARWRHEPLARISTDYFIGMPCMHIAQPLVVIWFLRRWRRMVIALAAYDCILVAAVLLLEWHYVVDILAGIVVAGLAIAITGGGRRQQLKVTRASIGSVG
jgi:hypothetical protein